MSAPPRRRRPRSRDLPQPVDELRVGDHSVLTYRSNERVRLFHVEVDGRTIGWVQGDRRGRWRAYLSATGLLAGAAYPSRCRSIRALVKAAS